MEAPLCTARLRLRPFHADDLDALHALWADPAVGRWLGGAHAEVQESVDELGAHLMHQAAHGFSMWAAEERSTGQLVGEVGLQLLEMRGPEIEIGWAFARDAWGRGYATEAARAWLAAGFEQLALDRVVATVLPGNAASMRVAERIGMRLDGRRHAHDAEHLLYVAERSG